MQISPVDSSPKSTVTTRRQRIKSVDAIRGMAMALIIFAHTRPLIDTSLVSHLAYSFLYYVTNISTVAFMTVNGMMYSYFLYSTPDWLRVYRRFAKRALLLLLCHPFIKLLSYPAQGDEFATLWAFFGNDVPITDTIALCLLITPLFTRRMGPRMRLGFILCMLIGTPFVLIGWMPTNPILVHLKEFLFGKLTWDSSEISYPFPLIPWMAVDICGSYLSESLAHERAAGKVNTAYIGRLKTAATILLSLSLVLIVGYKILKGVFGASIDPVVLHALYPSRTTALLPCYLGLLLFLFAYLFPLMDIADRVGRFAWAATVFGRTSLFTYLTQFAVAMSLPCLFGLKGSLGLPGFITMYFSSLTICWLLAYTYGRVRGWITPGELSKRRDSDGEGTVAVAPAVG